MPKAWSVVDFIVVMLGGLLGSLAFVAASAAFGEGELLLVLGLAGQYIGQLVVIWVLARRRSDGDLGFAVEGTDFLYLGVGLVLQLALAVLFLPLATILMPEGDPAQQISSALAGLESTAARVAAVVVATVVAPITEELTFRGVLLRAMGGAKRRTVVVVTALVFAGFHVLGLAPDRMLAAAAVVIPQLFIVGAILAWVTLRTGRLGPAIFIHSGFNLLAAIVLLIPADVLESLSRT